MNIEINRELLSEFLWSIVGERECVLIRYPRVILLTKTLDPGEELWHVEGDNILWPIRHWKYSLEKQAKFKEYHERERILVDERKQAFETLKEAIARKLKISNTKIIEELALSVMQDNSDAAAEYFTEGEISLLPKLKKPLIIMTEGKEYIKI